MTCHLRHDHPDNLTPYDALHSKCIGCGQIIIGTYTNFVDLPQQIDTDTDTSTSFSTSSIRYPSSRPRSYRTWLHDSIDNFISAVKPPTIYKSRVESHLDADSNIIRNQKNVIYHPDGSVTQQRRVTTKPKSPLSVDPLVDPLDMDSDVIRNQRNVTYHPDGSVTQQRKVTTKADMDSDVIRNQRNVTYYPDGSVMQQRRVFTKPKTSGFFSDSRDKSRAYIVKNSVYHTDGSVSQQCQQVIDDLKNVDTLTKVEQKIIDHPDGSVTHRKIITKEPDYINRHKIVNKDGSISYRKYTFGGYEDIIIYKNGTITRRNVDRKDKSSSGIGAFNLYGKF